MDAKWKDSSVRRHTRRKRATDCLWAKKTEVKWRISACGWLQVWSALFCVQNESVTYQIVRPLRDQTKFPQVASNTIMSHVPGPAGHVWGNFHGWWVDRRNSLCCMNKWRYHRMTQNPCLPCRSRLCQNICTNSEGFISLYVLIWFGKILSSLTSFFLKPRWPFSPVFELPCQQQS